MLSIMQYSIANCFRWFLHDLPCYKSANLGDLPLCVPLALVAPYWELLVSLMEPNTEDKTAMIFQWKCPGTTDYKCISIGAIRINLHNKSSLSTISYKFKSDMPMRKRHSWYYSDVIMSAMTSQITGVWIVCSTVCSGADQRKHQSFTGLGEGNPPVTGGFP